MNYYWVRIYDYKYDNELKEIAKQEEESYFGYERYKGVLLEEYYIRGEELTRDKCKEEVVKRSNITRFAKARQTKDCVYAIVMDSNEYYYNRYYEEVDTVCFNNNCGCRIKGKAKDYPCIKASKYDETRKDDSTKYYFCSYEHYNQVVRRLTSDEGEWQTKTGFNNNGGIYGYIYHIFNRKTMKHYIGQTLYMPFFRWQEHVKDGIKGDICDLSFEVITDIRVKSNEYVNNVEAWWIRKFIKEYGRENVMNITVPKLTMTDLIEKYEELVNGQMILREDGC